jgi:hypothetical protein
LRFKNQHVEQLLHLDHAEAMDDMTSLIPKRAAASILHGSFIFVVVTNAFRKGAVVIRRRW